MGEIDIKIIKKHFLLGLCLVISSCSSYKEADLSSTLDEELFALKNLPCEAVGGKSSWNRSNHTFLCSMGAWSEITYTVYEADEEKGNASKAVLLWKEYQDGSFFPYDREKVEIVLGRLSDKFSPNDRMYMLGFASRLNTYTFYTDYLKIKHKADYYKNTPEPYFLHKVSLESLQY